MSPALDELVGEGRLAEAIQFQKSQVREQPANVDRRYQLFVLLGFAGDLERAGLQLDTLEMQDPKLAHGLKLYRSLLLAEAERRRVYTEGGNPLLPPDPPAQLQHALRVLSALREGGNRDELKDALDVATASRPGIRGRLNGEPFEALRDYDDSLVTVLEVYAGGRYLWMPFERLRKVETQRPERLIDCLWLQAHIEDVHGKQADVHLPILYESSFRHPDERVRLGRMTEWLDQLGLAFLGAGQRELLVTRNGEEEDVGILSVRGLEIEASSG